MNQPNNLHQSDEDSILEPPPTQAFIDSIWKPSEFLKEIAKENPTLSQLVSLPSPDLETKHINEIRETTLMSLICS